MKRICAALVAVLAIALSSAAQAPASKQAVVKSINIVKSEAALEVSVVIAGKFSHKTSVLSAPDRLVIDVSPAGRIEALPAYDVGAFGVTAVRNDQEHSLEIELPFLQRSLKGDFRLLPVMVRAQEPQVARKLGEAVAKILKGKNSLLVASTDLSHFYEQEAARLLDAEMLRCMESFEPDSIFEAERTGKGFACGHAATAAVLWAARQLGGKTVKVLNHATSGDVTGDYGRVVGYGAAVVLKPRP